MVLLWVRKTICFSVRVYEVLIQSALCVDVVLLLSINKHMSSLTFLNGGLFQKNKDNQSQTDKS